MKPEPVVVSKPAAVQQPLLLGHQPVAGLWFGADTLDEAERARRLLDRWRPGASVLRFPQGECMRFAVPVPLDCSSLRAWPLQQQGRALSSAPLSAAELATMPAADLWLVQGGQVTALNDADGVALDPSRWLAVDGVALHDTYDCQTLLPAPTVQAPPAQRDLREVLGGRVPPASDAQREFLAALDSAAQDGGRSRSSRRNGFGWPSWLALPTGRAWRWPLAVLGIAGLVAAALHDSASGFEPLALAGVLYLLRWVWPWLSGRNGGASSPARRPPDIPARGHGDVQPQAWRRWFARLAMTSQLARLLGHRQAAYLRKTLELFESGRLDEALRHAIPLGNGKGSLGQAFGTPGPRADLSLSRRSGHAVSVHLGDDLDSYLRRLYRRSFEKLDRERRIDEAVFVLAELLQCREEAVDYLEKHERFKQAAELALAWDLPADLIVRLHCLCGDWLRALAVARRDNAFAAAVLQLEKKWPVPAARLREEWAQSLAAQGEWLGAVEAIWPLAAQQRLAIDWLLAAEAAGGPLATRALVKRAQLLPATLTDCAAQLEMLRDDSACHAERAGVARALLEAKGGNQALTQLARIIAPATLADHGAGRGLLDSAELKRLLTLSRDACLLADLPAGPLPGTRIGELASQQEMLHGELPPAGSHAIFDAVALDGGQFLVALGEGGAMVIDALGRPGTRFAVPAQRLVIAHSRQVALAMARRDRVWRVGRIDLTNRRVADIGVGELAHVATEFDGIGWTVAAGTCLRVLDTRESLHEVLWQVTDLPGRVRGLTVNAAIEQVALEDGRGGVELWRYALPQRRLLARGEAVAAPAAPGAQGLTQLLNPNGGVIDIWLQQDAAGGSELAYHLHGRTWTVAGCHAESPRALNLEVQVTAPWMAVAVGDGQTIHWHVIALATGRVHARIAWPATAAPQARIVGGHCIVFDGQGRLWGLDTATSRASSLSVR